jgi:hypothetical protein
MIVPFLLLNNYHARSSLCRGNEPLDVAPYLDHLDLAVLEAYLPL